MTEVIRSLDHASGPRLACLNTNVYNALADALSPGEVRGLADAFRGAGVVVAVSPVNLWEVVSTRDVRRRDELVWVMQHASEIPLLPEVEVVVARQVVEMVEDERLAGLRFDAPSRLAREWELTRHDGERTLCVTSGLDSLRGLKTLHRLIHAVASRGLDQLAFARVIARALVRAEKEGRGRRDAALLTAAIKREMREVTRQRPTYAPVYGEVAAMVASGLLLGLTPYPDPIDAVMERLGGGSFLTGSPDRLRPLTQAGSVMALSMVAREHAQGRYNAGNWFDGYHLQYLQVVQDFYTLDGPLVELCHRQTPGGRFVENVHEGRSLVEEVVAATRASAER